jgi:N-acetylglutamate synthase-like GNAT family acetyltransferase
MKNSIIMDQINIKTGIENMDVKEIHRFLTEDSYWAKGISFELVKNSMQNSFCIGAFINNEQIGFGRVITDYNTFGWFADFYVLEAFRGQGIAKKMLSYLTTQPWTQRLRRIMLNTSDAQGLYRQFEFKDLTNPTFILEVYRPNIHLQF